MEVEENERKKTEKAKGSLVAESFFSGVKNRKVVIVGRLSYRIVVKIPARKGHRESISLFVYESGCYPNQRPFFSCSTILSFLIRNGPL